MTDARTAAMISGSEITEFQKKVYLATSSISGGKVSTYGLLAKAIGCGSPRAVGQALRENPFAPVVPCHRVISSTLSIGGFQGRTHGVAVARKRRLLASEGVRFCRGILMDSSRVVMPAS